MFVKNMLTHVHKVIHKVVGTFARSGEEIEAKNVTRSDQMLASGAPARSVSVGRAEQ
jgi:hypothetical protein